MKLTAELLGDGFRVPKAADLNKVAHLLETGSLVHDMSGSTFRVRAKSAGPEGSIFKLADLQGNPVPTPADFYPVNRHFAKWAKAMRYVLAYNADWDMYVKEYIKAAGLPVDESYNWAKWFQAKFYPKLKGDDEVKDEAIHQTIITALATRKALDPNNPHGFQHAIKRFPPGVQALPVEKQVTQFLLTLFSGRVQEANQFIDKMQRPDSDSMDAAPPEEQEDQSTTNILDTEEHATGTQGQELQEFKKDMNLFRDRFAEWLGAHNRPETAQNYLRLFDAQMYAAIHSHQEPAISDIYPYWAHLTKDDKHPKGLGFDSMKQYWQKFPKLVREFATEYASELQGNPIVEFLERLPKAQPAKAPTSSLVAAVAPPRKAYDGSLMGPNGEGENVDAFCPLCGHTPVYREDPAAGAPKPYFCHACSRGFDNPRPKVEASDLSGAGGEYVGDNQPGTMACDEKEDARIIMPQVASAKTATRVRISDSSGVNSGKVGVIIPWNSPECQAERTSYPFVGGRTPESMGWVAVKLDDGTVVSVPKGNVQKTANDISGDISEAQSAIVSPDTVDSDIKQPTEPMEKQAKFCPKCTHTMEKRNGYSICPKCTYREGVYADKTATEISGDIEQARAATVPASTVDRDIKQKTENPLAKFGAGETEEREEVPCAECGAMVSAKHGYDDSLAQYLCDDCYWKKHCPDCEHPWARHIEGEGCDVERGDRPGGEGPNGPEPAMAMGPCGCQNKPNFHGARLAAHPLEQGYPKYEVDRRPMRDYNDAVMYLEVHGGTLMEKIDAMTPWHVLTTRPKTGSAKTAVIPHEFTDGIRPQTNVQDTGRLEGDSGPQSPSERDPNWRVTGAAEWDPETQSYSHPDRCTECDGTGVKSAPAGAEKWSWQGAGPCPGCKGTGKIVPAKESATQSYGNNPASAAKPGVGGAAGLSAPQNPDAPNSEPMDPNDKKVLPPSPEDEEQQGTGKRTVPPDLPNQMIRMTSLRDRTAAVMILAGADKEIASKIENAMIFDTIRWSPKFKEYICKRTYFYTHGTNEDKLAEAVKKLVPDAVITSARNYWHSWPKESYWEVRFKVPPKAESATPEAPATTETSEQGEAMATQPKAQGATASQKRAAVLEKIKARKASKNDAKWAKLRRVADENAPEAAEALDQLAQAFGELADRTEAFRENLDLVDAPKSASLKTRIAARRSLGTRLRKLAAENPELLGNAVNELFHALDDVAAGVEAFAENMGIELTMTPAEEAFVDEGKEELEGNIPAEEKEPVKVDEEKAEEGEEELGVEANSGAGARGWTDDRDESGNPRTPIKVDRGPTTSHGQAPPK